MTCVSQEGAVMLRGNERQGQIITSDVDLFYCLAVLLLQLHLNGGPKKHILALHAVLAAGCRQSLVI